MVRSLALIVLAIQLSRPTIPRQEALHYAKVLQQEAKEHDFDPFTGVAIIHFESYWHPGVVSKDGEDYGLAQIRARYVRGCRGDEDPLNDPSTDCLSAKARLLDGATNIRRMAALITANRELCKEKTGRVWFHEWLASYQGRNRPKEDKWCTPGDGTWRVVNYRKELIAKLIPKAAPTKHGAEREKSKPAGHAQRDRSSKRTEGKPAARHRTSSEKRVKQPVGKRAKGEGSSRSEQTKRAKAKRKASLREASREKQAGQG
ncbi:MAG: hypothetical protein KC766_08095 [Myxococcales bacterium]|nr:hypothetical protein [Myxococcales bacterium]